MKVTERQRWLLVAGIAGLAASQIAAQAMAASWQMARGEVPPEDPADRGFNWTTALLFGAATGAAVGVAEILARGAAEKAWKRHTGRKPPRGGKRRRRLPSHRALIT